MAEVGQVLAGRYKLVELLGQGGMATIFRGHDTQLGRDVAVKVLRAEYGRDPAFVARFRQEAQSAAALSHPNVVQVFDYGMEAGDPFIVMEMIDGGDLAVVLTERGAFEPLAAARIAQQIFEALDAAHGRSIVHRDIKPTNVLLTTAGRVKVADFGIARAFSEAQLTMPGTTLGSVHYFSPEQARGEMVTTASDVYSAGLVLFEMLTGKRAWTGDSAGAVAVARLAGDPAAPSSLRSGVPQILDIAVRRALARVPADRPTAGDMAALLGRFIADPEGATAGPPPAGIGAAAGPLAGAGVGAASGMAEPVDSGTGVTYAGQPPMPPYDGPQTYGGTSMGSIRRGVGPRQIAFEDEFDEDQPQSSGAWGWIAAVLGILVLVAGGVLLFLLLSNRGGQPTSSPSGAPVAVPAVIGMSLDQARQAATANGLILSVSGYEVTDEADEGEIIAQEPASGGQANRGSELSVTVATHRQTVAVPDLSLRTEAQAFELLAQFNLTPGLRTEAFDPQVPATLIIGTSPRAGIEVARGTAVDYIVSLGPAPTAAPTPTPSPSPIPTTPPPVTPVPTVPPTVPPTASPTPSPAPVPVGNYATCETLGQAMTEIQNAGLALGAVFPAAFAGDPNSFVAEQYPAAGTLVPLGTQVHLYIKAASDTCP
ncbi:MAG TPA: Stk1 family PASTA domain-containing Ser/Thr kinase [Candidatus Limnocylindria bacterium]|nr:Stk1 family PASTA domain-containing Ser/Thr kinase [Candidatus Limnocylindria bacterium]